MLDARVQLTALFGDSTVSWASKRALSHTLPPAETPG
jgi:hypothetical protein